MLGDMDVAFIEKTADGGKRFDTVEEGDVVILPAFGASLEEMQLLDKRDVTVVDTTAPPTSVMPRERTGNGILCVRCTPSEVLLQLEHLSIVHFLTNYRLIHNDS